MKKLLVLFLTLIGTVALAQAQSTGNTAKSPFEMQESSKAPASKSATRAAKKAKKNQPEPTYGKLEQEYTQRMEANVKKYNKIAKELEKPQYSDPMYFGHKKPPKKRPAGKKKFCKECQMRH